MSEVEEKFQLFCFTEKQFGLFVHFLVDSITSVNCSAGSQPLSTLLLQSLSLSTLLLQSLSLSTLLLQSLSLLKQRLLNDNWEWKRKICCGECKNAAIKIQWLLLDPRVPSSHTTLWFNDYQNPLGNSWTRSYTNFSVEFNYMPELNNQWSYWSCDWLDRLILAESKNLYQNYFIGLGPGFTGFGFKLSSS